MSSTGSGYDYSAGTFSPDGRIFQVEYALKAVENSGTALGIKCSDGVVVAVGKAKPSKMLVAGSNKRVFALDAHVGVAITGYGADGRQIVNRGREEARSYKDAYGHKIVPSALANRLALYVHYFTCYGSLRPFGTSSIVAAYDEDEKSPELYMIEPSGACYRFFACAAGRGTNAAKTELEKVLNKYGGAAGITCRQGAMELAKILHLVREQNKDKPLDMDMGWLCAESNFKFAQVPAALVKEVDTAAEAATAGVFVPFNVADDAAEAVQPEVARGGVSESAMEAMQEQKIDEQPPTGDL